MCIFSAERDWNIDQLVINLDVLRQDQAVYLPLIFQNSHEALDLIYDDWDFTLLQYVLF